MSESAIPAIGLSLLRQALYGADLTGSGPEFMGPIEVLRDRNGRTEIWAGGQVFDGGASRTLYTLENLGLVKQHRSKERTRGDRYFVTSEGRAAVMASLPARD